MKRLLLIISSALCLSGCVYPSPYGYSRYATTVTPVYPQTYYEHRYYAPPPPRYRYSERDEHRPYFQQRRRW
jgi:hypothetical protein